jgi:hypothetical protein
MAVDSAMAKPPLTGRGTSNFDDFSIGFPSKVVRVPLQEVVENAVPASWVDDASSPNPACEIPPQADGEATAKPLTLSFGEGTSKESAAKPSAFNFGAKTGGFQFAPELPTETATKTDGEIAVKPPASAFGAKPASESAPKTEGETAGKPPLFTIPRRVKQHRKQMAKQQ